MSHQKVVIEESEAKKRRIGEPDLAGNSAPAAAATTPQEPSAVASSSSSAPAPAVTRHSIDCQTEGRPLPEEYVDARRCLSEYGFAIVPGIGKSLADELNRRMGDEIASMDQSSENTVVQIAGEVQQYSMGTNTNSTFSQFRARFHELVMSVAAHVGVSTVGYHVQDEKLLVATFGTGEQAPHFDRDDSSDVLKSTYSVILYLTDHSRSTAFPTFKQNQLATPQFYDIDDRNDPLYGEVSNGEAMRQSVADGLLEKHMYRTIEVLAGDMVIFNQGCMHYGSACSTLHSRIGLFCVLTNLDEENQDEYQVFRWTYTRLAYGQQSRELAEAMYKDREYDPIGHVPTYELQKPFIKCLLRWGFITWQLPTASESEGKYDWLPRYRHRKTPRGSDDVDKLFNQE